MGSLKMPDLSESIYNNLQVYMRCLHIQNIYNPSTSWLTNDESNHVKYKLKFVHLFHPVPSLAVFLLPCFLFGTVIGPIYTRNSWQHSPLDNKQLILCHQGNTHTHQLICGFNSTPSTIWGRVSQYRAGRIVLQFRNSYQPNDQSINKELT